VFVGVFTGCFVLQQVPLSKQGEGHRALLQQVRFWLLPCVIGSSLQHRARVRPPRHALWTETLVRQTLCYPHEGQPSFGNMLWCPHLCCQFEELQELQNTHCTTWSSYFIGACCCAALQADGLLQRHSHLPLVNEAAAVLVHASKHGPAALQVRLTCH
jgi:hypothetical protein